MKRIAFIIIIIFTALNISAQTDSVVAPVITNTPKPARPRAIVKPVKQRVIRDSVRQIGAKDSANSNRNDSIISAPRNLNNDTILKSTAPIILKKPFDTFYRKLLDNPFLRTTEKPVYLVVKERKRQQKDEIFYLLSGLMFFLAFIKLFFSKYFSNIFRLFIQPTFRQKQTREQLQQSNLPSFLLNMFFIFSVAAYVSFLIQYYQLVNVNFWWILLYSVSSILVLYLGKFIFLSFAGWVFNVKEATDSYIFSVYLINKILGIILIPFTLILAFSTKVVVSVSITISLLIILLLFIYRFIMSYAPVRKEIKVNFFHFLFYIFAFEIVPLLLIYKTLIILLNKSA